MVLILKRVMRDEYIMMHRVSFCVLCVGLLQLQRQMWNHWSLQHEARQEVAVKPLTLKARAHYVLVFL